MAKDLSMSVDDQMIVCLEVMANGEDMLSIGAWEAPIRRLAMKEYAVKIGNGYRITDRGRAFLAKSEGVSIEEVVALEPVRPDWVVTTIPAEMGEGLVVLRKNEMTVSGYEAMAPRFLPIVQGHLNDVDTVLIRDGVDQFLQAMLDAAWAKGLRPTDAT